MQQRILQDLHQLSQYRSLSLLAHFPKLIHNIIIYFYKTSLLNSGVFCICSKSMSALALYLHEKSSSIAFLSTSSPCGTSFFLTRLDALLYNADTLSGFWDKM